MDENNTEKKEYREVVVVPLAARREALALIVVISLIVLLMGLRFSSVKSVVVSEGLRSYQMADLKLKNQAPTLYRSLLGSVGDILDLYEEDGYWPDIVRLNNEALPPFASDFLPMGLRGFSWKRHEGEGWVDYFGVNDNIEEEEKQGRDPLENSFLLRIIDLQSVKHPHPHFGGHDKQGKRFAFQVWLNPQTTEYPGEDLIGRGWKWIVSQGATAGGKTENVISEQPGQ